MLSATTDQALANTLAAMPAPKPVELSRVATRAARRDPGGAWRLGRNIPECVTCHGPAGSGVGRPSAVAGAGRDVPEQPVARLAAGTRRNDPNDLMGHIAKSLSEEEIRSVSQFFATLGQAGGQP